MTADEEGWIEGMADFYSSVDDAWAYAFVMSLGTRTPSDEMKQKFIEFVSSTLMGIDGDLSCSTDDIINMILYTCLFSILIFIFILDILKFKLCSKFFGLIISCIGKIFKFFRKLKFLFNNFLCGKAASMTMKGGNTEEVYKIEEVGSRETRQGSEDFDNRLEFAESLQRQHPDVVKITQKWGRWHHNVNYSAFPQVPIIKEGLNIPKGANEYGLKVSTYCRAILKAHLHDKYIE